MPTNLSAAITTQAFNSGTYGAITASFVRELAVTLEGRSTTFLDISLEASHSWPNGIFQNARYLQLVLRDGSVQAIAKSYKLPTFRKTKAATPEAVVQVVNRYLARIEEDQDKA
jgi:hypothetical protein